MSNTIILKEVREYPFQRAKPTSSSGLRTPNCTLLMRRNGHALSLEGGPCILSIQRDASSPGTPLCKKEHLWNATKTLLAPNGDRNLSDGGFPVTTVSCYSMCFLNLCLYTSYCSYQQAPSLSPIYTAVRSKRIWENTALTRLYIACVLCYRFTQSTWQGLNSQRAGYGYTFLRVYWLWDCSIWIIH